MSLEYAKFINFDFSYEKNITVDRKWYNFSKPHLGSFSSLGTGSAGLLWDPFENVLSTNAGLSLTSKGIINSPSKDNYQIFVNHSAINYKFTN